MTKKGCNLIDLTDCCVWIVVGRSCCPCCLSMNSIRMSRFGISRSCGRRGTSTSSSICAPSGGSFCAIGRTALIVFTIVQTQIRLFKPAWTTKATKAARCPQHQARSRREENDQLNRHEHRSQIHQNQSPKDGGNPQEAHHGLRQNHLESRRRHRSWLLLL